MIGLSAAISLFWSVSLASTLPVIGAALPVALLTPPISVTALVSLTATGATAPRITWPVALEVTLVSTLPMLSV